MKVARLAMVQGLAGLVLCVVAAMLATVAAMTGHWLFLAFNVALGVVLVRLTYQNFLLYQRWRRR